MYSDRQHSAKERREGGRIDEAATVRTSQANLLARTGEISFPLFHRAVLAVVYRGMEGSLAGSRACREKASEGPVFLVRIVIYCFLLDKFLPLGFACANTDNFMNFAPPSARRPSAVCSAPCSPIALPSALPSAPVSWSI